MRIFILIGIILQALQASPTFDVSGSYDGYYRYFDNRRQDVIGHFRIDLHQDGSVITGTVQEPRTDFGPKTKFLYADVTGSIQGNENRFTLTFLKRYRYNPRHTVNYEGTFKRQDGEIAGIWNIGGYKGDFKIFGIAPQVAFDMEPPKILLMQPFIKLIGEQTARGLKRVPQAKDEALIVEGIASDDTKIAAVTVNGRPATLGSPSLSEQSMIVGNSVKFKATLHGAKEVHVVATDLQENRRAFTFSVDPTMRASAPMPEEESGGDYARKFAVLIGIDRYAFWPGLEFAKNDALAMETFLKKQGYQTILLSDKEATRDNMLKVLGYQLPAQVGANDAVVIYFAGHGHTETLIGGGKEGYIIPVDAQMEDSFLSAISMQQLKSITRRIKAKHILFLMDSCYSGTGFTRAGGIARNENRYIDKVMSYRAVQMITAGGMNEQVQELGGHGIFTRSLLDALQGKADADNDGYITGSELGSFVRPDVTRRSNYRQTPNFGRFEGEGEFVFRVGSSQ